jgi:pimeloyl-ACP methyl ester carboxylesterase
MATGGIRYARVGDASIAYRVIGERGPYLAIVLGPFPGLLFAEHPATRASVEWAARFGRPVVFDVQGSGRSDPLPSGVAASVEHESEQLIAVLTAAGIGNAFIFGTDIGGAVGVCVTRTDRQIWARGLHAPAEFEWIRVGRTSTAVCPSWSITSSRAAQSSAVPPIAAT